MDGVGGLPGWKWIFILEGLATLVCSGVAAFFLPESIAAANFLSEEEKEFACKISVNRMNNYLHLNEVARFHQESSDHSAEPVNEKSEAYANEKVSPEITPVHMLDERFEWGEVIRGTRVTNKDHFTS
jgi:hypothetical protein